MRVRQPLELLPHTVSLVKAAIRVDNPDAAGLREFVRMDKGCSLDRPEPELPSSCFRKLVGYIANFAAKLRR